MRVSVMVPSSPMRSECIGKSSVPNPLRPETVTRSPMWNRFPGPSGGKSVYFEPVWQPARIPVKMIPRTTTQWPIVFRNRPIMIVKSRIKLILGFDVHFSGVCDGSARRCGLGFVIILRVVVVVVVAAVVIVALILRHIDVVQDDADQVAADFFDHLLGTDVH